MNQKYSINTHSIYNIHTSYGEGGRQGGTGKRERERKSWGQMRINRNVEEINESESKSCAKEKARAVD